MNFNTNAPITKHSDTIYYDTTKIMIHCLQTPDSCKDVDRRQYKDFTFDHSYWSFDPNDENYASQEKVRVKSPVEKKVKIIGMKFRD